MRDHGRIDVLVNNAGFAMAGFVEDLRLAEIRQQAFSRHDSNVEAFFFDVTVPGAYAGSRVRGRDRFRTFAAFHAMGAHFPQFRLKPEYVAVPLFGKQGHLNFPEFPEFSRCWLLFGEEEQRLRVLFNSNVLRDFENFPAKPCSVEGHGEWLLMYREGGYIEPDELQEFVETTTMIATILAPSRPALT